MKPGSHTTTPQCEQCINNSVGKSNNIIRGRRRYLCVEHLAYADSDNRKSPRVAVEDFGIFHSGIITGDKATDIIIFNRELSFQEKIKILNL